MPSNEFGQRADYIAASALGKVWINTRGPIDLIQEKISLRVLVTIIKTILTDDQGYPEPFFVIFISLLEIF